LVSTLNELFDGGIYFLFCLLVYKLCLFERGDYAPPFTNHLVCFLQEYLWSLLACLMHYQHRRFPNLNFSKSQWQPSRPLCRDTPRGGPLLQSLETLNFLQSLETLNILQSLETLNTLPVTRDSKHTSSPLRLYSHLMSASWSSPNVETCPSLGEDIYFRLIHS
jgi:hypothetical protein